MEESETGYDAALEQPKYRVSVTAKTMHSPIDRKREHRDNGLHAKILMLKSPVTVC